MFLRPVDDTGDILPVLSSAALLKGAPAAARLARDRLEMLSGEWWENPARGNAALEMLRETRFTEADLQALAAYLASYIRETPGIQEVRDVSFSAEGRKCFFSCTLETDSGSASLNYELLRSHPCLSTAYGSHVTAV